MAQSTISTDSNAVGSAGVRAGAGLKGLLAVLWIAWAVILFGGLVVEPADAAAQRIPTWCRMTSSLVLVAAGWLWWSGLWRGPVGLYAALIAAGMSLGCLGDFFNADLVRMGLSDPVLGGIISFGLGHICYIAACVVAARRAGLTNTKVRWASIAVWMLVGVVGWYFVAYLGTKNADLKWPGLPYTLLLAGTAAMATWLAVQDRRFVILALGAALFFVRALVLAVRLFHQDHKIGPDTVWLLYGPGQMLIVYALVTAAAAFRRQPG